MSSEDIINIYVDEGSISFPYFNFYLDEDGSFFLVNRLLDINKSYRFNRLNKQNNTNPFYIRGEGLLNNNITITGNGSINSGIIGEQTFILSFSETLLNILPSLGQNDKLIYFSTSNNSLSSNFNLYNNNLPVIDFDNEDDDENGNIENEISNIGTISIVFDENRLCTDGIVFDENTTDSDMLNDPNSSREALQRLRILKTRETGNEINIPITTGRYEGRNISFIYNTHEDYKMRRKAEILNNYNKSYAGKKQNYSYIAKFNKYKYKNISNTRIKNLIENQQCLNSINYVKPATNSGIFGDNTRLYLDRNVNYHENI
jgi:hypothetical protein